MCYLVKLVDKTNRALFKSNVWSGIVGLLGDYFFCESDNSLCVVNGINVLSYSLQTIYPLKQHLCYLVELVEKIYKALFQF